MDFDIETTIEDSIRLKKALQMSKFTCDKMQKELKEIKSLYEEETQKSKTLKKDYCQLQRKYQQSYTESIKDNNSLISQIQQLKKIIDEKQRDMEQIQIKLIPSLDQDMLRVKLITEMQGPYQQTVDLKDKEIDKLKNKITELQRNLQITSLSLKSKVQDLKKQNQNIRTRYEEQTNRLMQELNLSLSRYEVQSIEASIVKNQKREIQQLKSTIEFVNLSEQKNLQEIKELKNQRKNLLEKLMMFNSKQALLLEGKHNISEIQKLKDERLKHIRQIQSLKTEKQKMLRQLSKFQQEKTKLTNEHEKQITSERSKFMNERNEFNSEIYSLREELRMLKNYKIQGESHREVNYEKIKTLEKQVYLKTRQIQGLRLESSRMSQRGGNEQSSWRGFSGQKAQDERKYKETIDDKKQNDNTIINKKKTDSKEQKIIQEVRRENEKLKKKLGEANQKILELIREKMKSGKNISPQRDRIQSNIEKPMGVFLEHEDCGFTPLIEPTLYTYHHSKR